MNNMYNLVQHTETGLWEGRLNFQMDDTSLTFPATGETASDVISTIDRNVEKAGLTHELEE